MDLIKEERSDDEKESNRRKKNKQASRKYQIGKSSASEPKSPGIMPK